MLSLAIATTPACLAAGQLHPRGDLNEDYLVNSQDLRIFAAHWLDPNCTGSSCQANIDGIAGVNMADFAIIAENRLLDQRKITLVINEFMARNNSDSGIRDEWGYYDDWIELYNYGDEAIDIGGLYLRNTQTLWQVPRTNPAITTVASHGYILIWADEEPGEGVLHTTFALGGGDQINLYDSDMNPIDSIVFGSQAQNKSYGRLPDGNDYR
jgi:hypothetical protein